MTRKNCVFVSRFLSLGAFALCIAPLWGQGDGFPQDWSHKHLIFSNPGSIVDALKNGSLDKWNKINNDPRYQHQKWKREHDALVGPSAASTVAASGNDDGDQGDDEADVSPNGAGTGLTSPITLAKPKKKPRIQRDWSMSMGSGAKVGAGQFPAKFSFTTGTANCDNATTPDFVVYNTGLAGSGGATGTAGAAGQASIIAFDNLYSGCSGTIPKPYWSYNTGGTVLTSVVLSGDGKQVAFVHSAAGGASLVILKWKATEGNGAGSGSAAAKPSIPATQTTSGSSYATCRSGATSCQLTLAFNGGDNDTNSSPFYDYFNDVLYVGGDTSVLHKFTGVFNGTPGEVTGGGTASGWPQTMTGGTNKLTSPVFDATSGNVIVGSGTASNGRRLSRIPAAGGSNNRVIANNDSGLATSGSTGIVDAPLVDSQAGKVYVFLNENNGSNAVVYQFSTSFATGDALVQQSLGNSSTSGTAYDGAFDNIYFSSSASSPTGSIYACGRAASDQTPTLYRIPITANAMGTPVVGTALASAAGPNCSPVSEFFNGSVASTTLSAAITTTSQTSVSVTSGTGFANTDFIKIDSEIMKIASGGGTTTLTVTRAQLGTTAATHLNGAAVNDIHDWMFLGVTASGNRTGCTGACLYSFDVTSGALPANATAGLASTGGTSGIIIDNSVGSGTLAGASQVYFTPLSNSATACVGNGTTGNQSTAGCAVQASQSALQ